VKSRGRFVSFAFFKAIEANLRVCTEVISVLFVTVFMYVLIEIGRDGQYVTITNRKGQTSHNSNVQSVELICGVRIFSLLSLFQYLSPFSANGGV